MPNLFRIDFIQGKTTAPDYNQVKHSLNDTVANHAIISLSVSADKLQSVSNYSREPKRLAFECFPDTWIQDNILSGDHEHERYISHFEVKVYRDGLLFFSGIIDTSQLSFDISSGVLKISCYDKIKLLSLFSDLTHYYSLTSGYLPSWILSYFLQDIQQLIPISIPYSSQLTMPTLNIPTADPLVLTRIDYAKLIEFPNPASGWSYSFHSGSWPSPFFGYRFDQTVDGITYCFAHKKIVKASHSNPTAFRYQGRYMGRIVRLYNGICPTTVDYDKKTDWVEDITSLDNEHNELIGFLIENGVSENSLYNLSSGGIIDNRGYGQSHYVNHWVEANCNGNLFPSKLQPGKSYENYQMELTDNFKVLQAMLMLYNATIFSNASGQIILKNKDYYAGNIINIADNDVVSYLIKRGTPEQPEVSIMDVFAGDTTQLRSRIKDYLIDFHDSKWCCEAVIDQLSKYNLSLQSRIRIQGKIYAVTELERNFQEDEYKVKAWLL